MVWFSLVWGVTWCNSFVGLILTTYWGDGKDIRRPVETCLGSRRT